MRIAKDIRTDMVVHARGEGVEYPIGTVEGIKRGRYIKLRREAPNQSRDYIPLEWVESVSDNIVRLSKNLAATRQLWLNEGETKRHRHHNNFLYED
jgi:hypothetical protein